MGSELAFDWIAEERMAAYTAVGQLFADGVLDDTDTAQGRFALIFRMFEKYASGLPSGNFSIDRTTGAISRNDPGSVGKSAAVIWGEASGR
jgi:hypothetical protein